MTQEFVTLPREVVEQAIAAMQRAGEQRGSTASEVVAMEAMRAALEQSTDNHDWYQLGFREGVVKGREELSAEYPLPADLYDSKDWRCGTYAERVEWLHTMYEDAKEQIAALEQPQNHVPDVGNMVQAGWMPVPVEPTEAMLDAGCEAVDGPDWTGPNSVYRAMLDAAPQPPALEQQVEQESTCKDSLQVEQEPAAEHKLKDVRCECCGYMTHHREHMGCIRAAQPKREPLTDEQARRIYNSATYSASLAVFMTRIDAEHPDADDKGVSGWLQEAEDRVKHRTIDAAHEIGQAAAPQQGEQEPVAWLHQCNKRPDLIEMSFSKREPTLASKGYKARPLIFGDIAHPQPKREPLTHYEIHELFRRSWDYCQDGDEIKAFARAIEAAHNIK